MTERGTMTVREAGRRGGEATLARHGVEHFRRARQARTDNERRAREVAT